MRSPWKTVAPLEAGQSYLVLASSLPARSIRSTGRLFRGSRAVRHQLAGADGLVGFSLLARPLKRQYATLSVWRDEAALRAFAGSAPHGELMRELAPLMEPTTFVRWTVDGSDGRPSWSDALGRLAAAAPSAAPAPGESTT